MSNKNRARELSATKYPPAGFYFQVTFFMLGIIPNPLDIRFRKVSGISVDVETEELKEGGENLFRHHLPKGIKYNNLTLERGMLTRSLLNTEFNATMSLFKFSPSNVLVSLLDEESFPMANWLFLKAYPVKWAVSDLDASSGEVVIDTMELAYTRFQSIRI